MDVKKIGGKILYWGFIGLLVAVALILIISRLPIGGSVRTLAVLTGSMEPAIWRGSVVVVVPAKDYKIGDVITFGQISKTKTPTTHRVKDIKAVNGRPVFITQGDANNAADSHEVSKGEIFGKVRFSVPILGYAVEAAKKPIGFALIVGLPALAVIVDEVGKIWREIKKSKKKEEGTADVADIDGKKDDKNI